MPRPIQARIHIPALANNLAVARRYAPHAKVWAVVKANAYGHGIKRVYEGFKATDGFALLDLNEAVLLRDLGWRGPILLLEGLFEPADLVLAQNYELTLVVHCEEQLTILESAQPPYNKPLAIYLKMNSGMNRLGFKPTQYMNAWQRLRALPHIGEITIMTHFSDADSQTGVDDQFQLFTQTRASLIGPLSCANSAAILWHPQTHGAWVRPGIMLYGASPSGLAKDIADTGLQATMTLSSQIIAIQNLQAGETVGYGRRFNADTTMRVGIVACGYADGYPRHAPNGTPIIVAGVRTRTLGRVSMDMICADLSMIPQANVGSPVELWGQQLAIDDVANPCGTIGYELMCGVAQRVPMVVDTSPTVILRAH